MILLYNDKVEQVERSRAAHLIFFFYTIEMSKVECESIIWSAAYKSYQNKVEEIQTRILRSL